MAMSKAFDSTLKGIDGSVEGIVLALSEEVNPSIPVVEKTSRFKNAYRNIVEKLSNLQENIIASRVVDIINNERDSQGIITSAGAAKLKEFEDFIVFEGNTEELCRERTLKLFNDLMDIIPNNWRIFRNKNSNSIKYKLTRFNLDVNRVALESITLQNWLEIIEAFVSQRKIESPALSFVFDSTLAKTLAVIKDYENFIKEEPWDKTRKYTGPDLVARSKLIEALRSIFPKVQGLQINDKKLSKLLMGDSTFIYSFLHKGTTTDTLGYLKTIQLSKLFEMHYCIINLQIEDLEFLGISLTGKKDLEFIKRDALACIEAFIFSNPFETTFISKNHGVDHWKDEYNLIKTIWFAHRAIKGKKISFQSLVGDLTYGVSGHLSLGKHFDRIGLSKLRQELVKLLPVSAGEDVSVGPIINAIHLIRVYKSNLFERYRDLGFRQGRFSGQTAHPCIEYEIIRNLKSLRSELGIDFEVFSNHYGLETDTDHKYDIGIKVDENFRALIKGKIGIEIPSCIKEIALDFTLRAHPGIFGKGKKYYQSIDRYLIIPVYGWVNSEDIKYYNERFKSRGDIMLSDHIKVVTLSDLLSWYGASKADCQIMKNLEDLDEASIYDQTKMELLEHLSSIAYDLLQDYRLKGVVGARPLVDLEDCGQLTITRFLEEDK